MIQPSERDPTPAIRVVFLASFVSANLAGAIYLLANGYAGDAIANPLAVLGGALGVGLAGMMLGGVCGLALRLLLARARSDASWGVPIVAPVAVAGALGFVVQAIMNMLLVS